MPSPAHKVDEGIAAHVGGHEGSWGMNLCAMKSTFYTMGSRVDRYAWIITTMFFLLGANLLLHHEMWRDEIQDWLLARDSNSVPRLFANLKYEGHPGLWYLLLMP